MASNPDRPVIAINADFIAAGNLRPAHARVDAAYFDAVLAAGGLPFVIPPVGKKAELAAYLDRADGVLLTGGPEIDPRRYGPTSHPAVRPMSHRREETDRLLVRLVIDRRVPVLAMGVGMQQLTVAAGGVLYLHLPEDQPRALPHFDPSGGARRHAVLLEPGTRVEEIYGGGEVQVSSCHHQAVRQVGADFHIAARAPDGVIEAVEAADPGWFCVGVQWHPEAETASAPDRRLFECFVRACVQESHPLRLVA